MASIDAPVADWVTIPDLHRDPFPIYERLRAEGGVHWVPDVGRYLITSYDAVHATEFDQETFSANEKGSLQIRAMGHSMLRRDDPEHYIERRAWQPALRPGVVKKTWRGMFERNADRYLDELIEKGPGADLIWDFAAPYSAECLREILGLHNVTQQDMQRWSQALIDATGNYADDPEVWARGKRAFDEVDVALDEMLAWHAQNPNESLLSSLLSTPDELMPIERIRANVKMTIGGGLNEPRDALGVAAWALLSHPEQRRAVEADASLWGSVFDETLRWIAPIGLYSRQVTRDVDLTGIRLPAGARLGICILSANRDESVWPDASTFDINREVIPHLAFSKGVHVCLGAWAARSEVADIALPKLFGRLPGLALLPERPAEIAGWVFRGMLSLPVGWDDAGTARSTSPAARSATPAPSVAIVGSGPAGCFSAQAIRRTFPDAQIDVYDALPTPYGLVRYGVAPDHRGTRSVTRQFDRLFLHEGVRFHGNTRLGEDLTLPQLRSAFDAVVLATGVHTDARLGIPGDALPGVHGAGRITRAVNGHPAESEVPALGAEVVVVGHGNVAMDVVRLLATGEDGFDGSDLDDRTRSRLAGAVRVVHVVGRSAPESAKFDPVMVRELAGVDGVHHVVHGVGDLAPAGKDARADAVRLLTAAIPGRERMRVEWWFGLQPVRVEGDDKVTSVVFRGPDGEVTLPADDVITAVGFQADADTPVAPGLHSDARIEAGLYVAGWLRRGPRGSIPDQRADAGSLVRAIAQDIDSGAVTVAGSGLPATADAIDFEGWRRIDAWERSTAAPGRERAKLRRVEDLVAAAKNTALVLAEIDAPDRQLSTSQPVTVLFGTESGGAELVAGELAARLVSSGVDVRMTDLADISPEMLDAQRLHVLVCSTYGDGEVPTSARAFHRALLSGAIPLDGLRYAAFGLGDRSYAKTYSRGCELIDEALSANGATRLGAFGRHDAGGPVEAVDAAVEWLEGVLAEARAVLVTPS